jgi:trk/ktr system potassium uptake protein
VRVFIFGGGKLAYYLSRGLMSKGHSVTLIDRDSGECRWFARRLKAVVVNGDATVPKVLEEAEVSGADMLLALTPNDEDNLVACQIAQREFHLASVFSVVNDPENEEVFHRLGIPSTFSTTAMITSLIEQRTQVDNITNLTPVVDGRLSLTELRLEPDSPALDCPLSELGLPPGSLVISVVRDGEVIVPNGSTTLHAGDLVAFVVDPAGYPTVLKRLAAKR